MQVVNALVRFMKANGHPTGEAKWQADAAR